jgi:HEAT repeat protein
MNRVPVLLLGVLFLTGGASGQTAKQKEEVERLVKQMTTAKDPKVRAGAANELGQLGLVRTALIRAAEPALLDALKDGDGEVRLAVINTLGVLEPYKKERIPLLLPLLKAGENRNTRLGAVIMLGRTEGGAKEAIPLLEDILKQEADKTDANTRDGEMIQRVNEALVGIRQHLLAGYIKAVQEDKDAKVRLTSATELAKLAQINAEQAKPAIPALVEALKDDNTEVRKAALTALGFAKPDAGTVLPGLIGIVRNIREDKAVRLAAIGMLGAHGPNARDSLPFLEFLLDRETKKPEKDRDKELFDKLTEAVTAIKK